MLAGKFNAATRTALDTFSAAPATAGFRRSGYQIGTAIFGATGVAAEWWLRSGIAGFAPNASTRFCLPERYTDPFGYVTTIAYDTAHRLYVASSTNAAGNTPAVERFDFVLAPARMQDANGNISEAAFDVLGLPVATAHMGKVAAGPPETSESGDTVARLVTPDATALAKFFTTAPFDGRTARRWLGQATARIVYHFGETIDPQGKVTWNVQPAGACGLLREKHERDARNIDTSNASDLFHGRWIV